MTMDNHDVVASVIIPAHDAARTVGRQLEALAVQDSPPPFEVIVVANCCSDSTLETAQTYSKRLNLKVVSANDYPSAAYARNIGVLHARGNYLLFCDADDEVHTQWVARMIEPLASGAADFVGGKLLLDRRNLPNWIFYFRFSHWNKSGRLLSPDLLPYSMTASLGITKFAFSSVGGFNESFSGAAGEDIFLQRRLFRSGFRVGIAPKAVVDYTPRKKFRQVLQQAHGYHRALRKVELSECTAWSFIPLGRRLILSLRSIGSSIKRDRYFHPNLIIASFALHTLNWRFDRRIRKVSPPTNVEPSTVDSCAYLGAPIIGGLAFMSPSLIQAQWITSSKGVELGTLRVLESLLPANGLFVDVGANVGLLTVAAALLGGLDCKVIAFEPDPNSASCLHQNLARHRVQHRVEVIPKAVGREADSRIFHSFKNSLVSGFGDKPGTTHAGKHLDSFKVDVVALDDAIHTQIAVLKVDVEGYEEEVFSGSSRLLAESPDVSVIFEINKQIASHRLINHERTFAFFPETEWKRFLIDERDSASPLIPINEPLSRALSSVSDQYFNVVVMRYPIAQRVAYLVKS